MIIEKRRKDFSNGFVSVLELSDGRFIETTSTCLPIGTEVRLTGNFDNKTDINDFSIDNWKEKWMIGVSTQSGCPIKCRFCAVNRLTDKNGFRNLTSDEICQQVDYAISQAQKTNGNLSFNDCKIPRILFTRMGEPSLNIDNVIAAIYKLKTTYPNARIQISTIGLKKSIRLVEELLNLESVFGYDWLELQFSIHSSDMEYRRWLQTEAILDNVELANTINMWYYASKNRPWKATLNFALTKDTPFDVKSLKSSFDPNTVFIKVSPVNENPVSDENGIKTMFTYENSI